MLRALNLRVRRHQRRETALTSQINQLNLRFTNQLTEDAHWAGFTIEDQAGENPAAVEPPTNDHPPANDPPATQPPEDLGPTASPTGGPAPQTPPPAEAPDHGADEGWVLA